MTKGIVLDNRKEYQCQIYEADGNRINYRNHNYRKYLWGTQ